MTRNCSPRRCEGVPNPGEAKLYLPGLALISGDELLDGACRNGRVDRERRREGGRERHGLEILERVIGNRVVQGWIDDVAVHGDEDGISVGLRFRGLAGADVAPGPGHVVHVELPAELLRQFLCDQARANIGRTAGRKRDDHAHRPGRIGLRPSGPRDGARGSGARCQMEKPTPRESHDVLLDIDRKRRASSGPNDIRTADAAHYRCNESSWRERAARRIALALAILHDVVADRRVSSASIRRWSAWRRTF